MREDWKNGFVDGFFWGETVYMIEYSALGVAETMEEAEGWWLYIRIVTNGQCFCEQTDIPAVIWSSCNCKAVRTIPSHWAVTKNRRNKSEPRIRSPPQFFWAILAPGFWQRQKLFQKWLRLDFSLTFTGGSPSQISFDLGK